jgi:hypothetical protein
MVTKERNVVIRNSSNSLQVRRMVELQFITSMAAYSNIALLYLLIEAIKLYI